MTHVRRGTPASLSRLPGTPGGRHPHAVGAESSAGPAGASMLVTLTAADLRALVVDAVADVLAELAPADAPALLDRRGLARALGCSPDQVDRLRREGCPELRLGDVPRFELPAVLAWLRSRGEHELPEPMRCDAADAEKGPGAGTSSKVPAHGFQDGESGRAIPSTCEGSR